MRIVLVDASRMVLRIIAAQLQARGHAVEMTTDGLEALALIRNNTDVDVVITSVELPSLSGLELCWEARLVSAEQQRPLHIIMMSSNTDDAKLSEALDTGADDFIRKPPSANALYARLRSAARSLRNERELIRLADIDPLTELLNRRAFFERAKHAIERASSVAPLSAIMLDIDRFKQVNDCHGHDVGDQVIRAVAREISRVSHLVGRLGGEEFAVVLADEAVANDRAIANAVRISCSELSFEGKDGPFAISCSFGVARWQSGMTIDRLLKRADLSLYEAKRLGRNRVVCDDASVIESARPQQQSSVRSARPARPDGSRVEHDVALQEATHASVRQ
jgi:two-component system, cell cycle response regulator